MRRLLALLGDRRPFGLSPEEWRAWLKERPDRETESRIRTATRQNRPLGSDAFVKALESRLQEPDEPGV